MARDFSAGQGKNSQEYVVYFKNFLRCMAEIDPPFGRFDFFHTRPNNFRFVFYLLYHIYLLPSMHRETDEDITCQSRSKKGAPLSAQAANFTGASIKPLGTPPLRGASFHSFKGRPAAAPAEMLRWRRYAGRRPPPQRRRRRRGAPHRWPGAP